MYLLDTNICIYAIKNKPVHLFDRIKANINNGINISSLTIAEMEFGIENSLKPQENRIALLKFISLFNIVYFDDQDAIPYGRLKAKLKKEGNIIGPIDMLLAAQAISKKLIFVTNNIKEFSRIDNLKLENWIQ
jgi:tRNA(fMet)-specific endonuclease VapC